MYTIFENWPPNLLLTSVANSDFDRSKAFNEEVKEGYRDLKREKV